MQRKSSSKKNIHVTFAVDDDVHIVESFKSKRRLWFTPFEQKKIEKRACQLHSRMGSIPPALFEWIYGESVRGLEDCFVKTVKTTKGINKNNKTKKPSFLQARITSALVASIVWALNYSDLDGDDDDDPKLVGNLSREEYNIVARAYSRRSERDVKSALERARLDEKFVDNNIRGHLLLELELESPPLRTPQEENLDLIVGRHTGLTMNYALMAC